MATYNADIEGLKNACREYKPAYAFILGSGIRFPQGDNAEIIAEVSFADIPDFGGATVHGHPGVLRLATVDGKTCLVFAGRRHLYEGLPFERVTYPVKLASELAVGKLIITNSAGGLNPAASVGDIVLLEDFIIAFDLGIENTNRFELDPVESLDETLAHAVHDAASTECVPLKSGVYAFMPGPAYETAAEVAMLRRLGADVVGMSTAPEWWAALRAGISVAGISIVTNVHRPGAPLPSHEEVLEAANSSGEKLSRILTRLLLNAA